MEDKTRCWCTAELLYPGQGCGRFLVVKYNTMNIEKLFNYTDWLGTTPILLRLRAIDVMQSCNVNADINETYLFILLKKMHYSNEMITQHISTCHNPLPRTYTLISSCYQSIDCYSMYTFAIHACTVFHFFNVCSVKNDILLYLALDTPPTPPEDWYINLLRMFLYRNVFDPSSKVSILWLTGQN